MTNKHDEHHGGDFMLILIAIGLLFLCWRGALFLIGLVSEAAQ